VRRAIQKHLGDFIAILVLLFIAVGVSAYIVGNQNARSFIPLFEPKPYTIKADFSDAQAVTPGQGQTVRVAGVEVGKITDVKPKSGIAEVTMQIQPKWKRKIDIRSDATALLRPRTGLKDMFVELDPGGRGTRLKDGDIIPVQNTAPDIDPDEILSALDTDTRSYLQLLINGAGKGLSGHGNDLNQTFKALGPTNRDLARVTTAVASRRVALKSLIHNYGDLTNTLADTDGSIHRLVNSSDAVFRAFASQDRNISAAVAKLPPTLRQTQSTLVKANSFAKVAGPALNSLRPAFRELNTANHEVRPFVKEAEPILRKKIRPFVQVARPVVRDLRPASVNLAKAAPDLTTSFHELNRFFDMAAYNPKGREPVTGDPIKDRARDEGFLFWLGWLGQNTNSIFSTSDAQGPLRRFLLFLNCTSIRQTLAGNAGASLLGITNALNNPGLCPSGESTGGGGGLLKGKKNANAPDSGTAADPSTSGKNPTKVGGR
jgi:phospholipid/cholesterol/gamma-HCH transport system substrate-binding protein